MLGTEVLAITSLVIALATVVALIVQIRHSTRMSRRASNLNFLSELTSGQIEAALDEQLVELGLGSIASRRGIPLDDAEVDAVLSSPSATGAMHTMLNHLENIAIAHDHKLVDRRIWQRVHGKRLQWWASMLQGYIRQARETFADPSMWSGVYARVQHGGAVDDPA